MKTALIWVVSALFGFAGGIVGQRMNHQRTRNDAALASPVVRATNFQLVDNAGRVLSTWGVDDQHGRIAIWFNDEKGQTRAIFGNQAGERPTAQTWAGYRPAIQFEQPDGDEPFWLGVDRWGRPHMAMGDANWHGRVTLGPINESDVVTNAPPEPNAPWGITFHAPQHVASAYLGVTTPRDTKETSGFIVLKSERQGWIRDAARAQ